MSLANYFFNRTHFERYLNCSAYSVDAIPLEKRRSIPYAVVLASLGVFFEALYIPCTLALWRLTREQRHLPSCYPFMFYLGVVDCSQLANSTFVMAYLCVIGGVYCSAPVLVYVSCTFAMVGWFAGNTTVVILALNRCIVIVRPDWDAMLFKGRRKLAAWISVATVGALVFSFFVPTVFFSSVSAVTYHNPHMFYMPDEPYYHSAAHIVYNWFIVMSIIVCYTVFLVNLMRKVLVTRTHRAAVAPPPPRVPGVRSSMGEVRRIRNETKASAQVLVTCCFVFFTSLGFIYTELLKEFGFALLLSYIGYEGSPSLVYLSMNRMIRHRILQSLNKDHPQSTDPPTTTHNTVVPQLTVSPTNPK